MREVGVSINAVHENWYRTELYRILQHYYTHSDVMLDNRAYADIAFLLKMTHTMWVG